jgi:hypothetical protein
MNACKFAAMTAVCLSIFANPVSVQAQTMTPAITNGTVSCTRVNLGRMGSRNRVHAHVAAWWDAADIALLADVPTLAWNVF